MAKTITVIPPTRDIFTTAPIAVAARRRVAGYARVSTDSDEQFTSYEAQIDYYTTFIKSKPEWDFVRVYTDEGMRSRKSASGSGSMSRSMNSTMSITRRQSTRKPTTTTPTSGSPSMSGSPRMMFISPCRMSSRRSIMRISLSGIPSGN